MAADKERIKMTRHYYAGKSYMGTNYSYDSACWTAYAFDSKVERDTWLAEHEYKDGNRVAEVIDRATAHKIAGVTKYYTAHISNQDNRLEAIPV